jgi:hypothetical protein
MTPGPTPDPAVAGLPGAPSAADAKRTGPGGLVGWLDMNVLGLLRDLRWTYLPPLMVYLAAGVSGLTAIVGTFFVKEYLGLSAEFLAALGFWAGLPWALKMPLGHLVDLFWRWKAALVWLGASLIAASMLIMIGLLADPQAMRAWMSAEAWFVLAALLGPVGYVMQDVVADAMTVEAVPRLDEDGEPLSAPKRRSMHTTMQTLGRVAIIGGGLLVSIVNVVMLRGVQHLPEAQRLAVYIDIYWMALAIPAISVAGVLLAAWLNHRRRAMLERPPEAPPVNWWVLGGGAVFALVSIGVGLGDVRHGQEMVFAASMAVILTLMWRLMRELEPAARASLLGTAIVIFVFRALPGPGAGSTWWMIDELGFDQQFLSELSLVAGTLALAGLFIFRRYMAEKSIYQVVGMLTVVGAVLSLPTIGMYHGLHEWTAARTGGIVDARFIALIDTALESPLGQIAMVPMLAWIANSAPAHLKATFFAVMASFTNLALSASQLGTKYLNQLYTVTREVRDASGAVKVAADYSQLGELLVSATVLALVVPLVAIALVRRARLRSG